MNDLILVIAVIVLICFVITLFFLFGGEPDVYDRLHELAMGVANCKAAK